MEYKLVCCTDTLPAATAKKLEKKVEELIKEGYKPYGTVAIYESESGWVTICQAMIKE